jgi:hypothetical protein
LEGGPLKEVPFFFSSSFLQKGVCCASLVIPSKLSVIFIFGRPYRDGRGISLSLLFNFAYFSRPVTSSFNKDENV